MAGDFIIDDKTKHRCLQEGDEGRYRCPTVTVSVKLLRRCLHSLTRSEGYRNATLIDSIRYGLDGQPAGVVTEEEYRLSQLRLEKVLKRRERADRAIS